MLAMLKLRRYGGDLVLYEGDRTEGHPMAEKKRGERHKQKTAGYAWKKALFVSLT